MVTLIKSKSVELPTYPGVALELQRLISSGNYGLGDLARLVEADQALATELIRMANSAFYVGSDPITTLPQAITRVGANSLSNIALAGTLSVKTSMEGPLVALRKETWRRSLMSALLCRELAPRRRVAPGEAFLAGLLHDFGETLAYAAFEIALELHPGTAPQEATDWAAEAKRYHVELGMTLAAEWKLPEFVAAVVARHHDAEPSGEFSVLIRLVALSDAVIARLEASASLDAVRVDNLPGVVASEVEPLRAALLKIPAFLEAFGETPRSAHKAAAPSLVAPAPESPGMRAVDFALAVTTRAGKLNYRAKEMSRGALRMVGAAPQAERQLIHLELEGSTRICATVKRCEQSATEGFVVELQPFAMDGAATAAWARLAAA